MEQIVRQMNEIARLLKSQTISQKEILNHSEACEYTGISASTMYKLTSGKMIPHFKPSGKLNYFLKEDLDNWLLTNRQEAQNQLGAIERFQLNRKGGGHD